MGLWGLIKLWFLISDFINKNLPYINLIFLALLSQIINILMNRIKKIREDMIELLNLIKGLSGNQKLMAEAVSKIIKDDLESHIQAEYESRAIEEAELEEMEEED